MRLAFFKCSASLRPCLAYAAGRLSPGQPVGNGAKRERRCTSRCSPGRGMHRPPRSARRRTPFRFSTNERVFVSRPYLTPREYRVLLERQGGVCCVRGCGSNKDLIAEHSAPLAWHWGKADQLMCSVCHKANASGHQGDLEGQAPQRRRAQPIRAPQALRAEAARAQLLGRAMIGSHVLTQLGVLLALSVRISTCSGPRDDARHPRGAACC
jgi:hypothetical protein